MFNLTSLVLLSAIGTYGLTEDLPATTGRLYLNSSVARLTASGHLLATVWPESGVLPGSFNLRPESLGPGLRLNLSDAGLLHTGTDGLTPGLMNSVLLSSLREPFSQTRDPALFGLSGGLRGSLL